MGRTVEVPVGDVGLQCWPPSGGEGSVGAWGRREGEKLQSVSGLSLGFLVKQAGPLLL